MNGVTGKVSVIQIQEMGINECGFGQKQKSGGEVVDFVTVSAAPSDHDEGG